MARIELNVTISNGSENSMRNLLEMKNLDHIHKKRNGLKTETCSIPKGQIQDMASGR